MPESRVRFWVPILLNTILVVIALYTFGVASDRRVTVVEQRLTAVENAVMELKTMNKELLNQQNESSKNLAVASTVLQNLCEEMHTHLRKDK